MSGFTVFSVLREKHKEKKEDIRKQHTIRDYYHYNKPYDPTSMDT